MHAKAKGKSQVKVKRETREETISRILDVQGQWLRGEIPDIAEFRRRVKGKGKGCSGGRGAQEKSKGTKSWQKEGKAHVFKKCDKATLRYEDDVPLNARRGAPVDESPHTTFPQHVLEPGWRSWTDTDTDSSTDSDCSLYIIWIRVEPQSWCFGRRHGIDLQPR